MLLRTLGVVFGLHALQLQPTPVDDLVSEDGDQDSLEDWPATVLVEVALLFVRAVREGASGRQYMDLREGCSLVPRSWARPEAGKWTACDIARKAHGAWLAREV